MPQKVLFVAVREKDTKAAIAYPKVAVFSTARSAERWADEQPTPYEIFNAKLMAAPKGRPKTGDKAKPARTKRSAKESQKDAPTGL